MTRDKDHHTDQDVYVVLCMCLPVNNSVVIGVNTNVSTLKIDLSLYISDAFLI